MLSPETVFRLELPNKMMGTSNLDLVKVGAFTESSLILLGGPSSKRGFYILGICLLSPEKIRIKTFINVKAYSNYIGC